MAIKDFIERWKTMNDKNVAATIPQTIPSTGIVTGAGAVPTVTANGVFTSGGYNPSTWSIGGIGAPAGTAYINPNTFNVTYAAPTTDILKLTGNAGKEILRVTQDGKVVWADPAMDEDEAAAALGRAINYSLELKVGVTKAVKSSMRDTVFEEIINIAKQKGSLTADDLTYLLEASKIVEKLKGG